MCIRVVLSAQPTNIERLAVVVVVRFRLRVAADLARLASQRSGAQCGSNRAPGPPLLRPLGGASARYFRASCTHFWPFVIGSPSCLLFFQRGAAGAYLVTGGSSLVAPCRLMGTSAFGAENIVVVYLPWCRLKFDLAFTTQIHAFFLSLISGRRGLYLAPQRRTGRGMRPQTVRPSPCTPPRAPHGCSPRPR